jgi:hypothetical protein
MMLQDHKNEFSEIKLIDTEKFVIFKSYPSTLHF